MPYVDYNDMNDFYTIQQLADKLEISKERLHLASKKYHVEPQKNEQGQWGFDRWQSCQIHNKLYKEWKATQTYDDPWS